MLPIQNPSALHSTGSDPILYAAMTFMRLRAIDPAEHLYMVKRFSYL